MSAPSSVFIISRAAEMLGEVEDWLQEIALEMEPEDGCLIVLATGDHSTTAFTREGVEYLKELVKQRKAGIWASSHSARQHMRGAHRIEVAISVHL